MCSCAGARTLPRAAVPLRRSVSAVECTDAALRGQRLSAHRAQAQGWLRCTLTELTQTHCLQAVRKNRYVILPKDIEKGYKSNVKKSDNDFDFYK